MNQGCIFVRQDLDVSGLMVEEERPGQIVSKRANGEQVILHG